MIVNVGEAKTQLSKLISRAEAGEAVEIARDGVPVVRLVRVEPEDTTPGQRFLAMHGRLRGQIWISDDFELTEDALDEIYDNPLEPPR